MLKFWPKFQKKHFNPCCPHIETSQLICTANQLTGFYMRATLALNELTHLYLKFKTSAHAQILITCYYILYTNFLTWNAVETYIGDTLW